MLDFLQIDHDFEPSVRVKIMIFPEVRVGAEINQNFLVSQTWFSGMAHAQNKVRAATSLRSVQDYFRSPQVSFNSPDDRDRCNDVG